MEFESDEERAHLLRQSARQRQALEGEVKIITENTQKIITNVLIVGGSLALGYLIAKQFTGGSKKKGKAKRVKVVHAQSPEVVEVERQERSEPGVFSQVGAAIASQASMFLLNLAKEKLMEYLQTVQEKKQQDQ